MLAEYLKKFANTKEIYLRIKALPGSAKTGFLELMADETVKISIKGPAEKGKANQELVRFLAKEFGVSKDQVRIISGAGERLKLIKITK